MNIAASATSGTAQAQAAAGTGTAARNSTASNKTASYMQALGEKFPQLNFGTGGTSAAGALGTSSSIKVAIDPKFQDKLANDPELAAEYEQFFADLPAAEETLRNNVHAMGAELVDGGVNIDKEGNITSWSVTKTKGGDDSKKAGKSSALERLREAQKEEEKKRLEEAANGGAAVPDSTTAKPEYVKSEYSGLFEQLTAQRNVQTSFTAKA
jgi:hypothetical protein